MRTPVLLVVLALAVMGCEEAEESDEDAQEDTSGACAEAPRYDEVEIFSTCTMCHSSTLVGDERGGALPGVDFDTYAAAMASASRGLERVQAGAMPPPTSGVTVAQGEVDALEEWILCGTPE